MSESVARERSRLDTWTLGSHNFVDAMRRGLIAGGMVKEAAAEYALLRAERCLLLEEKADRYRAALRDIAAYPVGDDGYVDIAKEALS